MTRLLECPHGCKKALDCLGLDQGGSLPAGCPFDLPDHATRPCRALMSDTFPSGCLLEAGHEGDHRLAPGGLPPRATGTRPGWITREEHEQIVEQINRARRLEQTANFESGRRYERELRDGHE